MMAEASDEGAHESLLSTSVGLPFLYDRVESPQIQDQFQFQCQFQVQLRSQVAAMISYCGNLKVQQELSCPAETTAAQYGDERSVGTRTGRTRGPKTTC